MCITMLRIYYSNFALSTWCVRGESPFMRYRFYAFRFLRARERNRSIRASDYPPRHFAPSLFRRRADSISRYSRSFRDWKCHACYRLHMVAHKSHNRAKYAGVRRRFGSWHEKWGRIKDFRESAYIFFFFFSESANVYYPLVCRK